MKDYVVELVTDTVVENERITTMKITFPRIVAEELLRHRSFSFCSQSSRAVPIARMIEQNVGFVPELWRKHQPGMSPIEDHEWSPEQTKKLEALWKQAMDFSISTANTFMELGIAKEVVNRLLVPFQWITLLINGNEAAYNNFFNLRCEKNAQFEIRKIALMMKSVYEKHKPESKFFHLPFIERQMETVKSIKISAARCARVSYYNHDGVATTPDADIELANRLKKDLHMSPFEFQVFSRKEFEFMTGGTEDNLSGNLQNKNLIQIRKLVERGLL
jgi:thymidylate synthase ThyX